MITFTVTGDAPDTATAASLGTVAGLADIDDVRVTATFAGNTGGALDVYVQRFDDGLAAWVDWIHFPQKASGAASNTQTVSASQAVNDIFVVGTGSTVALANDTYTGGHPGNQVRVWVVSGTSTSNGATVTVSFTGRRR